MSIENKSFTVDYEEFINNLERYRGTHPACPLLQALLQSFEILQGKWTFRVIFYLLKNEHMRFGELKKSIPTITNTMLTTTLKDLVNNGIVSRVQFNEIPPHVEYSLTESGNALLPVFYDLAKWSSERL